MSVSTTALGLFAGQIATPWEGKEPTAIGKSPVAGPAELGQVGLSIDDQADKENHGGVDKALHHYPADHYGAWESEFGQNACFQPGGFGENLSTLGLTEADVCIGDTFRLGEAVIQISQGRQPCWKLAEHTGIKEMAYQVRKTLRTGWYYRVIEPGTIGVGSPLTLENRPHPTVSVKRASEAFFNPKADRDFCAQLAEIPEMFAGWREQFAARLEA